jgi:putative flippase GtrA
MTPPPDTPRLERAPDPSVEAIPRVDGRIAVVRQFLRYALCGGLATGVDLMVFFAVAWRLIPALLETDPLVRILGIPPVPVEEAMRVRHYVICRAIAFVFSNFVAYGTNVLWVFEGGRHNRRKEIGLFFTVSLTSLFLGTGLGAALIRYGGFSTTFSYVANVVASVLINYAGRKFYVFHR